MSLYHTLSQLPNDLPLTLGKKVDPNTAKPQSDPLDAWFTPIVRDVKAKVGAKRPCPKLTIGNFKASLQKGQTAAKEKRDDSISHKAAVAESKASIVFQNASYQKEMVRVLKAQQTRIRIDEQQAYSRMAEIAGEAKQIVGITPLRKLLNEEFDASYLRDLKSEHYAAFIEKTVALVRGRIEQDSLSGLPLDYNLPTWV